MTGFMSSVHNPLYKHPMASNCQFSCSTDPHIDSDLFFRETGMVPGNGTGTTTDLSNPGGSYGRNTSRTGNLNDEFSLAQRPCQQVSEEPTAVRTARFDTRSPQYLYLPPTSHLVRTHEQTSPLQSNQGRQFSTTCNIRQHPRQFLSASNPQAVINRQTENRYTHQPNVKISFSEWLPIDLQHVQPIQQTLTIEDVVRYEMAVAGGFEMRGSDMDALYTLAGL